MTQPETFDSITSRNGQLYATRKGKDYALFIYTPLQQAYAGKYTVTLGCRWSEYNKPFVKQYVPMPVVASLPSGPKFSTQDRAKADDTWYAYEQVLCNGWPLYYVDGLENGHKTEQPAMFQPATATMAPPAAGSETEMPAALGDETGPPGPYLGP